VHKRRSLTKEVTRGDGPDTFVYLIKESRISERGVLGQGRVMGIKRLPLEKGGTPQQLGGNNIRKKVESKKNLAS